MKEKGPVTGIVSSRKCFKCGHHEIGIVTSRGDFYPLRPGMYVQIFSFEEQKISQSALDEAEREETERTMSYETARQRSERDSSERIPWLPDVLIKSKKLRLKYGVLLRPGDPPIDENTYKTAYIKKLQELVEKEIYPHLAVILDNFFQSPHLASGNSAEITINLLRDVDEVRRPIELMESWLREKTESALIDLIAPLSIDDLTIGESVSRHEFLRELEELRLEEFLQAL